MRKFTRVILLCLALVMGVSVAACGAGSETDPTQSASADPTDASTVNPTDAVTQAPTSQATQGATQAPTTAPTVAPVAVEGEGAVLWQVAVKDALTMSYVIKTKNNKIIVIES